MSKAVIGFAVVVLLGSFFCIAYLAFAVIAPDRAHLSKDGIAELSGIAAATAAAALATLTIAAVQANVRLTALTANQLRDQWEPEIITTRLNQVAGRWPLDVRLTNLSGGPAIDCVYVGAFRDPQGREMWHVTSPIDLLGGTNRDLALNRPHGYDEISYEASDTTSVDTNTGKRVRRVFRKTAIAFADGPSVDQSDPKTRSISNAGLAIPDSGLFVAGGQKPPGVVDRRDAVICRCANGHVHRTLPYLGTASERFGNGDGTAWVRWYMQEARFGIPVPETANLLKPPLDAVLVRVEPLSGQA